ncbi:hypothetical protein, partial [Geobacter argillaceus]|uniref:hypothetical protein n=1 Tax=Geobacter argillaceus TaxID=345631 RepID=UPI001B87E7DE
TRCLGSLMSFLLNGFFCFITPASAIMIGKPERGTVGYGSLLNGIADASPMTKSPAPGPC